MKMQKLFFALIFVKNGLIYIKQTPKWSPAYSTFIVRYILPAEMYKFA